VEASCFAEDVRALLSGIRGAHAVEGESWIQVFEQGLFVPLQLDPRRIPHDQIEAWAAFVLWASKHLRELELPVVRSETLGGALGDGARRFAGGGAAVLGRVGAVTAR